MKMGVYIDLQIRDINYYAHIGFKIFQKLYNQFVRSNLFTTQKINIWKGYPITGMGELVDTKQSLANVTSRQLIGPITKRGRYGYFETRTNYTLEVLGLFYFEREGEIHSVPGAMIFAGEETNEELPSIYVETFKTSGLCFPDFIRGLDNPNRVKVLRAVRRFYDQLSQEEKKKAHIFMGDTYDCIEFLHQCQLIIVPDKLSFFKRFLDYAVKLRDYPEKLEWLTVNKAEIKRMYKRIDPLKKTFIYRLIDQLKIPALGELEVATGFFINDIKEQIAVQSGSLIIQDRDFTGNEMKSVINNLVYKFSTLFKDSLVPSDEIQKKFIREFEKNLDKWK